MVGGRSDIEYFFAGVAVVDYERALEWYEKLFGRASDVIVREGAEAMWQLTNKAWVYVVHDPDRAGNGLLTMLVRDLELNIAALKERGIDAGEIEIKPGLYKKVTLTDPEGNRIAFGQNLGAEETKET